MPPGLSATPVEFVIRPRTAGKRIDAYLVDRFPDFSRSVIQKVIDAKAVLVNGQPVKASYKVKGEDLVRVWLPDIGDGTPTPENIPLKIVYEDEYFVVVDKDPGMVVHPARGNWRGTVVNALAYHFEALSTIGGPERPGVVHRLDRDTTGLLVVAKEDAAHRALGKQFEERSVEKEYVALTYGAPDRDGDYVEKPIGHHPTVREKMAVRPVAEGGREARTFYQVHERFQGYALVHCHPETGRTHQIRVHLHSIGHPIVADKPYSGRGQLTLGELAGADHPDAELVLIGRQALHAHKIAFAHPVTGVPIALESPLPEDMARTLDALRAHRKR